MAQVGDEIVEVDDTPLDGRPMGAVIDRSATMYSFLLTRYDTAMQATIASIFTASTRWRSLRPPRRCRRAWIVCLLATLSDLPASWSYST